MSRVETIEMEIQELTPGELADLREWFVNFDVEAWERQIEVDATAGRLDDLADKAIADHNVGKSREI